MKLIFLDVDGVLNCMSTTDKIPGGICTGLDEDKIRLLEKLVMRSGAKIVISSTWRVHQDAMEYLVHRFGSLMHFVIGATPNFAQKITVDSVELERGNEIAEYLSHVVWSHYVILDDLNIKGHDGHFVQTEWATGLTQSHVDQAMEILK